MLRLFRKAGDPERVRTVSGVLERRAWNYVFQLARGTGALRPLVDKRLSGRLGHGASALELYLRICCRDGSEPDFPVERALI